MTDLFTSEQATQDPDAPSPLAEMIASFNIGVGELAAEMKKYNDLQRRLQHEPVMTNVFGQPIWTEDLNPAVPATGPLLLTMSGPEVGEKWLVKSLRVSDGGNAQTAVVGKADFYVGQAVPPSGSLATWVPLPPISWRWTFANLPNIVTFSTKAITVLSPDNLYCVITGGTDEQVITAAAEVEVINIASSMVYETT